MVQYVHLWKYVYVRTRVSYKVQKIPCGSVQLVDPRHTCEPESGIHSHMSQAHGELLGLPAEV